MTIYTGTLTTGDSIDFDIPADGKYYVVEVRVFDVDGNTLTFQKYSNWKSAYKSTGDTFTADGTYVVTLHMSGSYQILCSGSGTSIVEVERRI